MSELRVLIEAAEIERRVREIGAALRARAGAGVPLTLVGVLTGSFVFVADLVRAMEGPVRVGFVGARSYDGTRSRGEIRETQPLTIDVAGHHVVLVEDIVDTGLTVAYLRERLEAAGCASLRVVALLDKPARRTTPVEVDVVGFTIEDHFVVGYGLDVDGLHRNLPHVAVIEGAPGAAGA